MIVISKDISLVASNPNDYDANSPAVGWHNLVTVSNVSATSANASYPVANMANPSTFLRWRSAILTTQYITVTLDEDDPPEVDYLAVQGCNFGAIGSPVCVEGLVDLSWTELSSEILIGSDRVLIFRFSPVRLTNIRLRIGASSDYPEISVLYVGKLLLLQRRIYVGHTPLNYGKRLRVTNARAESGAFLGRVVLGESLESAVDMINVTPRFFREEVKPFLDAAESDPFFWAWRPGKYPKETGFAWLASDPTVVNQRPNGMMSIGLRIGGVER